MEDEINYYLLENAIKKINIIKICESKNYNEEEIKKELNLKSDSKIIINKNYGLLSYYNHRFEEYFLNDENSEENKFHISQIQYSGNLYEEEFLGYKFYCNDKILILSRELNKYSSNFTFHEVNIKDNNNKSDNKNNNDDKNKDINKYNKIDNKNDDYKNNHNNDDNNNGYYYNFLRTNLFDKIDYNNYNIQGYKYYIYFYIYSLYKNNKKEKELNSNNIFIRIVDDEIDEYIENFIKFSKLEIDKYNNYIYIYMLAIKQHSAILINITGTYYLFDPSHYFTSKLEYIFKGFKSQIIILNKFKIQNLGTCAFHSINFLSIFISSILKDTKSFTSDLFNKINSYDFISKYINELNIFCGGKEVMIISNNNLGNKFFSFGNNIYLNKDIYKINFIDFNELLNFFYINDLNKSSLLLKKENLIYLKESKLKYLNKIYNNLINNRFDMIVAKREILYNEEIKSFKKKQKSLNDAQIENISMQISNKLKYMKNSKIKLNYENLKKKIKEKITFEFKINYLFDIENIFNFKEDNLNNLNNLNNPNNIEDIIIDYIQKNKKQEYFADELYFYLKKSELWEIFIINESKALDYIKNINNDYINLEDIDLVLQNLDSYLFELNLKINKLESFINNLN